MPKPKKIRKKKSFMFTTKHQSFNGLLSLFVGVVSIIALIACIAIAFGNRGELLQRFGGVGLFAVLSNVVGVVAALISFNERDIFVWVPRSGLVVNMLMIVIWILLLLSGIRSM